MKEKYLMMQMKFMDEKGNLTVDFFGMIARDIAAELVETLPGRAYDANSIMTACDLLGVLLDNGFLDSACCLFEYLHDKVSAVPEYIQQICEDESYAPMFLRAMSDMLNCMAEAYCFCGEDE